VVQIHSPRLTKPEALQRVRLRGFLLRSPPVVSSVVSWRAQEPLCRMQDDLANRVRIGLLVGCDQRRLIKPPTRLHNVLHGIPLPLGGPLAAERVPQHRRLPRDTGELERSPEPRIEQVTTAGPCSVCRRREDCPTPNRTLRSPYRRECRVHSFAHRHYLVMSLRNRVRGEELEPRWRPVLYQLTCGPKNRCRQKSLHLLRPQHASALAASLPLNCLVAANVLAPRAWRD
jgi:hypothetical protein